jgi:hypothetical protein
MRCRKHSNGVRPKKYGPDLETFLYCGTQGQKGTVVYDMCLLSVVWQEPMGL